MMESIFDKVVDRRGSDCIKLENLKDIYGREDLLAMWIADMDFETPDCIRTAIEKRLEHQVYGYSVAPDSYWQSIIDWESETNDWHFTKDELTFIPGIVRGIANVLQCFTAPGDRVVVQPPVYMPFLNVPKQNGREVVYNPLIYKDGKYSMDFENLECVCKKYSPKVLILANPHNPAGIVWGKEVLAKVAEICIKHNVIVISDEIHADMPLFGAKHVTFSNASDAARQISITFAAPSKTFNMAGIVSSFCVVYNKELRERFYGFLSANEYNSPMFLSTVATEAAFTKGNEWRLEMLKYIESNVEFAQEYFEEHIKGIKVVRPQASFLLWLDCNGLGLTHNEVVDLFVNKAHLALNQGEMFGPGGSCFMRFNIGVPKSILTKALKQLEDAINEL